MTELSVQVDQRLRRLVPIRCPDIALAAKVLDWVPKVELMREMTRVARSEWPPSSKKLSWMPGFSKDMTSPQIRAISFSSGVRGAMNLSGPANRMDGDIYTASLGMANLSN